MHKKAKSGAWGGGRLGLAAGLRQAHVLGLLLMAGASAQAQTVTRTVEYEYDVATGQVVQERVDPGAKECLVTSHVLDVYGNRRLTRVESCNPGGADFAPRMTQYLYAAQDGHSAGAFVTGTRSGKLGLDGDASKIMSRADQRYDPALGLPTHKTVSGPQGERPLTTRVIYDGLGRPVREYAPVAPSGDGQFREAYNLVKRVYCLGPAKTQQAEELAVCLNIAHLPEIEIDYRSRLNTTSAGEASRYVKPLIISAYYVETQSFGPDGEALGPPARVHYDSLKRAVAKEGRHFSGRWTMELTAFDELGLQIASWSGFYGRDTAGRVDLPANLHEYRSWTTVLDLLHRPLQQRAYRRDRAGAAATEYANEVAYLGLESRAIVPEGYTPDGAARVEITRKDGLGQVVQTVDTYGATLSKAYDAVGNLVQTVDAMGNVTRLQYSAGHARFKTQMQDPSVGTWNYAYDGLGQLRTQTDAKQNTTTLAYDELGRLVAKSNPDLNSRWYHDRDAAGTPCAAGHNRLCQVISGRDPSNPALPRVSEQRHAYDELLRAVRQTLVAGEKTFVTETSFDSVGRLSRLRYPTGFSTGYAYAPASDPVPGALLRVYDAASPGRVFWRVDTVARDEVFNARNQLVKAQLGSGVITERVLDPVSGKPFALLAGTANGTANVLDHRYEYDRAGNVVKRTEALMGVSDAFEYDRLNRLTKHALISTDASASRTVSVAYNAIGNILEKGDVGGYRYNAAGAPQPFAVQSAGGNEYRYDANGQLETVTGPQRRVNQWTAFNHPASLTYGSNGTSFVYGADYKRLKEEFYAAGVLQRRVYLVHPDNAGGLGYEREEVVAGANRRVEHRHYLSVAGESIGVVKTLGDGPEAGQVSGDANLTNYWHKDGLGSVIAVSNASGAVLERMLFDAWGRRQTGVGAPMGLTDSPAHGHRGFTGHEHLDELGLVHMNGRLYDPLIARFVSPDPHIQDPDLHQGYNRYSYVLNNPLRYTDPSGEFFLELFMFVAGLVMAHEGNQYWGLVGRIMMMTALSGPGSLNGLIEAGQGTFAFGGLGNAVASAGIATAVSPGASLDSVGQAMLFAGAFNFAGSYFKDSLTITKMTAHALIGCVQGAVSGGKCGPSALGAFVAKGVTEATGGIKDMPPVVRGLLAMIAGGSASAIGGGKFANGALQAGVGYLFNCLAHECNGAMYDSKDPNYHAYGPFSTDLCNVGEAGCMDTARFVLGCQSAIGQSGCTNVVGDEKGYVLPGATNPRQGNPITQYRASPDLIINGTSPGHELHDGYVVRWLSVNGAGTVSVWTAGVGVNSSAGMRMFNQYGGYALFRGIGLQNALTVRRILNEKKPN